MDNRENKEQTSMKIVAHWFTIPRVWRQGFFWLIVIILSMFGWSKLLSN